MSTRGSITTSLRVPTDVKAGGSYTGPGGVLGYMAFAMQVRRERRLLASLTVAELKDLGLTPGEACREAARPLFDLPDQNPINRRLAGS